MMILSRRSGRRPFVCMASGIVVLCAALAACSSRAPIDAPSGQPRIWDVRAERFVSERQLVADIAAARYRLLGEVHDNPAHHDIRARLIAAIADTGARPAVVLEQFDLDHDDALLGAQAARTDAEQLVEAGKFDRNSWKWPLHKPIIEVALATRLLVRAGNVSRAQLRGDFQAEVVTNTDAIWYPRLRAAHWTESHAHMLRAEIIDSHCGQLPEAIVPRLVLAQRVRDAALAQALVSAATADGAVLIAGNGHVRADIAVPVYLNVAGLPDAGGRSVSVGFIEVRPGDEHDGAFPGQLVADHPGFDYIWVTQPVARDDPCERFSRQ